MRKVLVAFALSAVIIAAISPAYAACTGTNGRGWGTGNGAGQFQMTAADKNCRISFPGFVDDRAGTRVPATNATVTKQPGSGKVVVSRSGLTYTPNKGFKGTDSFCTSNTTPKEPGKTLAGCISVVVN